MPEASRTETFDVPIQALYEIIIDYASYPEFVNDLKHVNMVKQTKTKAHGEFVAHSIFGDIHYSLDLKQKEPEHVSWVLAESDTFKDMHGSWTLEELDDASTHVTYHAFAETRMPAPKTIVRGLIARSLPAMLKAFRDRTHEVYEW